MAKTQLSRLYEFVEWVKEIFNVDSMDIDDEKNLKNTQEGKTTVCSSFPN